eukprot:scaffold84377_cov75-Phaeocystis_antarctica.AAC.9
MSNGTPRPNIESRHIAARATPTPPDARLITLTPSFSPMTCPYVVLTVPWPVRPTEMDPPAIPITAVELAFPLLIRSRSSRIGRWWPWRVAVSHTGLEQLGASAFRLTTSVARCALRGAVRIVGYVNPGHCTVTLGPQCAPHVCKYEATALLARLAKVSTFVHAKCRWLCG